jgi:CheY-like chemotaxis protein
MSDPTALVVDDEPLILTDTADMVSAAGYLVIEASSAAEAMSTLNSESSLRLLVTDIQMPGDLDGLALARHVGEHWPHVHILVASGAVKPEDGELPGGAMFLSKPLDKDRVLQVLDELSLKR